MKLARLGDHFSRGSSACNGNDLCDLGCRIPHSTNWAKCAAAMRLGLRHVSLATCDSIPPMTTANATCGARVGLLCTIPPGGTKDLMGRECARPFDVPTMASKPSWLPHTSQGSSVPPM